MATKKETGAEPKFSKEQIMAAKKFADNKDIVDALLDENKKYSIKAVEDIIKKFKSKEVK